MKFLGFIPAITWLILVTVLLCLPGSTLPANAFLAAIHADKWVHIGLFAILCLLFVIPFLKAYGNISLAWLLIIIISGIAYGTIMEFIQREWVSNRGFEVWDIAADTVGCILGSIIARSTWMGRVVKKIGPDRNRDRNQN